MTLPTRHSRQATELHKHNPVWEAPVLWKTEFLGVLALYHRKKLVDFADILDALDYAEQLIGEREHLIPAKAALEIMLESGCSPHRSEFVALARHLGTKVISNDKKFIEDFPDLVLSPEVYLQK